MPNLDLIDFQEEYEDEDFDDENETGEDEVDPVIGRKLKRGAT